MSDNEKNIRLRKWRDKLGYGIGWTFKAALIDKLIPPFFVLLLILAYIFSYVIVRIIFNGI